MATRSRARRVRRTLGVVAAVLGAVAALLLFLPLPAPVLSLLAGKSSGWMLDPGPDQGVAVARAGRKLAGLAVQQGLADAFLDARPLPKELPDAERVGRRLAALKPLLISQTELPHAPVSPPAALAGIGWCDAINGFAATTLAREFPRVEIVGVPAPGGVGGHSFGRLWSERGSEWLYFDLWTQEVSVFRSRRGRAAEYLFRARPVAGPLPADEDSALIARIHDRAWSGFVHNRLQSTLGGYLSYRVSNLVRHGDRSPAGAFEAVQAIASSGPAPDPGPPAVATRVPGAYVEARLAHFRGDPAEARRRYSQVLAAERGGRSTYGTAARIFIERIDSARRRAASRAALHRALNSERRASDSRPNPAQRSPEGNKGRSRFAGGLPSVAAPLGPLKYLSTFPASFARWNSPGRRSGGRRRNGDLERRFAALPERPAPLRN